MSRAAKIAIAALGVTVVAIVILVVVLVEHVGEGASTASKRVTPDEMKRLDTIVVLSSSASGFTVSDVEDRMNRLAAVDRYAEVPHRTLTYLLSRGHDADSEALLARACAEPSTRGYAVTLAEPASDSRPRLSAALGGDAIVRPSSYETPKTEIFMQVRATRAQTHAVKALLEGDSHISSFDYIDHKAAYEEFKKLFSDQKILVENETPSGLPESFRLELRDGASPDAVASEYRNLPGVDNVVVPTQAGGVPTPELIDVCKNH